MNPENNLGKNFLVGPKPKQKQRNSEECIDCKSQNKSTQVFQPVVRCKNCQGALCRNHSTGLVMLGGPYSVGEIKGLCAGCYNRIMQQTQPITQQANLLKTNIREAQNLIQNNKIIQADKIIDNIFDIIISADSP